MKNMFVSLACEDIPDFFAVISFETCAKRYPTLLFITYHFTTCFSKKYC